MLKPKIITIDGPAGAGKSTLAREIAKRFGYFYLDSGALYRAIGYACKQKGVNLESQKEVLNCAKKLNLKLQANKVLLNGADVSSEIRTPEAGLLASKVAKHPKVRELVIEFLRKEAEGKKVVIDGRDAGTYIFPEAQLKIFLTASPEERARRRYKELINKGFKVSYDQVLKEINERDELDKKRETAPLKIPEGALIIDTTNKRIEDLIKELLPLIDP
ncbi:(d)CMP kinase [Thermovibrio sp.]